MSNEIKDANSLLSQKSSFEFMHNCDLPPPSKIFSWSEKTVVMSSMNRICSIEGREDEGYEVDVCKEGRNEKLEVLKALRLSQTRAREAERKVERLGKERDCMSKALLEESLRSLAYRQWVKSLEIQVRVLQKKWERWEEKHSCYGCCEKSMEGEDGGGGGVGWFVALALCLGIAFGCRYIF